MKKLALITAALLSTTAIAGEFAEFTFTPSIKNRPTDSVTGDAYGLTVGSTMKEIVVDFQIDGTKARNTDTVTNQLEARVKYDFGPVWIRGGLGKEFSTGVNQGYYTAAVGTILPINKQFSAIGNVEYTDSFKSGVAAYTTYQVGAEYYLSKNDTIAATYVRAVDGVQTSAVQFAYTRGF